MNQCLEGFLRCFLHGCPTQWSKWLALAEYWYNTSYHTALGKTPFEVLYGHSPRHFGVTAAPVCTSEDLNTYLEERQAMTALIRHHLLRAQQRMKDQADRHRSERSFQVNDWVYFKLHPYIQRSVATQANQKLALKYYGPYKVIGKVGNVAYRLGLPEHSKIHPVVHVSLLKEARGYTPSSPIHQLPDVAAHVSPMPESILAERYICRGSKMVRQIQVQWTGSDRAASTWENPNELRRRFPHAAPWGQVAPEGGRDVMTDDTTRPARQRRPKPRVTGPDWKV